MKGFSNFRFMILIFVIVLLFAMANVQALGNTRPVIDSIDVNPEKPTKYNDLTCFVDASDLDGNLDYVDFKWYVNGILVRENSRTLYGSSDSTSDTLDSSNTDVNNYVVCQARVYDFNEAYAFASHAVRVGFTPSNSMPTVSYVDITPRHPNPQQDLTCSVYATDADDNLDYVSFEWYRNGNMIRTADKNIYGSSDLAFDILDSINTNPGDRIRCVVNVYDTYGSVNTKDSLPVVIEGGDSTQPPEPPEPPVNTDNRKPFAILSANKYYVDEGDEVYFSGFRSYDPDGYILQYKFDFGDGHQSAWLSSDTPYSYHAYDEDGSYYARLKVKDNEYLESAWSNAVVIRVRDNGDDDKPEIEDIDLSRKYYKNNVEFTCEVEVYDENEDLDYVKFRWYVDGELFMKENEEVSGEEDEAESEMNLMITEDYYTVKCEATVYDEERNTDTKSKTVSGTAPEGGKTCGLTVKRFDYYSYLTQGQTGWVEIEVQNTGESYGTLTIELYVNGLLKDEYTEYVRKGETAENRFEFPLSVGTHNVRVESYLPCGGDVSKFTEMTVFPLDSGVFIPSEEEPAEEITEINVIIKPTSLDIELNSGKAMVIIIDSPELTKFEISVEGIPEDWVNYPDEVEIQGRETVYMYIVPKEVGNYEFEVRVETDSKTFDETIDLYVAPPSEMPGEDKQDTDGVTGLITALDREGNTWIAVAIVSLLIFLTAVYFVAGRFKGKTYEEHIYGAPAEPIEQPRMMKGSLGDPEPVQRRREVDMSRLLPAEILKYNEGVYFPKVGDDFFHRQSDHDLGEGFGPVSNM